VLRPLLFLSGVALLGSTDAAAQQVFNTQAAAQRTVVAMRLGPEERIALDGRLDEAVWTRAVPAGAFIQIDPKNGEPATEATEVRIAFDDDMFYMGVTAFDSEPDKWIAYQRRRDENLNSDDKFRWTIDTFLDARSGYFFEMNPLGAMSDALLGVNGGNRAWDGIWNARARRSEIGWTLEIAIPFRTLNFNPNSDIWGINFERTVQRKSETSIWMGWARNQGLTRLTNSGRVTGITSVTQGRGLDIKPYGLFESQASPGRGNGRMDGSANAGVDLFYNPTPGMRANLTVNTDFAQTEVDQRQVNLTRFSLFFPERRDFFLDGTTFFDFGSGGGFGGGNNFGFFFGNGNGREGGNDQVIPFFSRRIGLSAAGTPQKIDFGTKVTGQMGGQDVGLFHVRTGDDEGMLGEDFTVARVKRRVLRQSYVGGLYTRRDARSDGADASHTLGVDARLATSSFLGSQNLQATAWLLRAARPGITGRNNAFGTFIAYPNDRWDASLAMREIQANFDPAIGFVTRHGYRKYSPSLTFGPRPRGHRYIRRMEFGTDVQIFTDLQNQLLERSVSLTLLQMQFHTQDFFGIEATPTHERLDAPFAISRTITLPPGSQYDYTRLSIRGQTANHRTLSVGARIETGGFYSGTRRQTVLALTLRAAPGYIIYMNSEWNQVRLREGAFATNVYRIVGETQFSPFVTIVNNVQYDTQSSVLGWQSRFRWIVRPGNDLYVVYNHNWLDDAVLNRFSTLDKRFASKVLYTYRF
jgi:hypothetical protein